MTPTDREASSIERMRELISDPATLTFNGHSTRRINEDISIVLSLLTRTEAMTGAGERLREALTKLEAANEALCRVRSQATYHQMMADCSAGELYDLDEARREARAALAQPVQDKS